MKLSINEIETLVFRPNDKSFSSAIKIIHRPSAREYVCDESDSQVQNRRFAIKNLISDLIVSFDGVSYPRYVPFDEIKVIHPNTEKLGIIREIIWHFKDFEWNYYIESEGKKVSKRYVEKDLSLIP